MKKTAWIGVCLSFLVGAALAAGFRMEVKGSYFSSENSIFREVYGSAAKFGLEGAPVLVDYVARKRRELGENPR